MGLAAVRQSDGAVPLGGALITEHVIIEEYWARYVAASSTFEIAPKLGFTISDAALSQAGSRLFFNPSSFTPVRVNGPDWQEITLRVQDVGTNFGKLFSWWFLDEAGGKRTAVLGVMGVDLELAESDTRAPPGLVWEWAKPAASLIRRIPAIVQPRTSLLRRLVGK